MPNAFESSKELRSFFNQQLDLWKSKHRSSLQQLADLCGVSASYLGQVGRYGRIPSKPVLLLLALHFELGDPSELYRIAGVQDPWPLAPGTMLRQNDEAHPQFLSLRVDLEGLTAAVSEALYNKLQAPSLPNLLRDRRLHVGLNKRQSWMFGNAPAGDFFLEIFSLLAAALWTPSHQSKEPAFRYSDTSPAQAFAQLARGELDIYGPVYLTPERLGQARFTDAICRVAMGGLGRTRPHRSLPARPLPTSKAELVHGDYKVAVLGDSISLYFAREVLGIPASNLIPCGSVEEQNERITMGSAAGAAHLAICDLVHALPLARDLANDACLLFQHPDSYLGWAENGIAIRSDLPEVHRVINQSLGFLRSSGMIQSRAQQLLAPEIQTLLQL